MVWRVISSNVTSTRPTASAVLPVRRDGREKQRHQSAPLLEPYSSPTGKADAVAEIRACYLRRYGEEPPEGTAEAALAFRLTTEQRVQAIYDMGQLIRLLWDQITRPDQPN